MQNANNSGSWFGPDLRIIPIAMGMHMDSDSQVRIQEFLCGPQIRIGSVLYGTVPLLQIQLGCKHFLCKGTYHLGHLVEAQDAISWVIPGPWYYRVGPEPPKPPELSFSYHFYGNPLNSYSLDGHPLQPGPWVWGVPPECLDAWLDFPMPISPIFSNVRCPASQVKRRPKCDRIAPSHPLSWPCVSDLLLLKGRELTTRLRNPRWLDSTTQN